MSEKLTNKIQEDHLEKDWLLQRQIELVNTNSDWEIGITFLTQGFLVSGLMISGKKYFELFGENFGSPFEDDTKASIIASYKNLGDSIYSNESKKASLPSYIHIKDAKFYNGSNAPIPADTYIGDKKLGFLWRARISEISGFSLVTLNATINN